MMRKKCFLFGKTAIVYWVLFFLCAGTLNYYLKGKMPTLLEKRETKKAKDYAVTDYIKMVPFTATHMAEGSKPTDRSKALSIHWSKTPPLDYNKVNISTPEIMKYYTELKTVAARFNKSMASLNVIKLLTMGNILPPDIQRSMENYNLAIPLTTDDNVLDHKLDYIVDTLKLLSERTYPAEPRVGLCDNCFVFDFQFLIHPDATKVCRHPNLKLLVLVTSVPMATKERMTIRETWGRWAKEDNAESKFVFLFGGGLGKNESAILQREDQRYRDILQVDLHTHLYNMTQTILMSYKWILHNCKKDIFIMRARDDTFVHLPNINKLLDAYGTLPSFLDYQLGAVTPYVTPPRYPWVAQYTSYMEFPGSYFPPYAIGRNYITSYNLTENIVKASPYIPYFPIDDVYIGFVLQYIGSGGHHIQGFLTNRGNDRDNYRTTFYFSSALESPARMKEIYNFFEIKAH